MMEQNAKSLKRFLASLFLFLGNTAQSNYEKQGGF